MEYIYAAMLLHKAGKAVKEDNLIEVLKAAGINADPIRVKALVASLAEIDIDEAIKSPPALITTSAPSAQEPKSEEKPKEEKEEEKEEVAIEGLGALFG